MLKQRWKRIGFLALVSLLLLLTLKGILYRTTVKYQSLGERQLIQVREPGLIRAIDRATEKKHLDLEQIVTIARKLTNQYLQFKAKATSSDPNQTAISGKAHCVGYSALFASIADYIIQAHQLENRYRVRHYIGQLYFLGYNVHSWVDHPFFQDHDFNGVEDLSTGKTIFTDPSVSDYLGIHRVQKR